MIIVIIIAVWTLCEPNGAFERWMLNFSLQAHKYFFFFFLEKDINLTCTHIGFASAERPSRQ